MGFRFNRDQYEKRKRIREEYHRRLSEAKRGGDLGAWARAMEGYMWVRDKIRRHYLYSPGIMGGRF